MTKLGISRFSCFIITNRLKIKNKSAVFARDIHFCFRNTQRWEHNLFMSANCKSAKF
jgi:hypothetical protein